MHDEPRITRRDAGERLGLSSGALSETVERLRAVHLLTESRAVPVGRGRPTTILQPHGQGPLVIIVELRPRQWTAGLGDLAGDTTPLASGPYGDDPPEVVLGAITRTVEATVRRCSSRVRAVVVAVAGTVSGTRVVQFTARGWTDVDLTALTAGHRATAGIAVLAGNDATFGGVAEARTGAARDATVALHLLITEGLGGVLLVDGQPIQGAHGRGGEFGHLPFGDPQLACPCGATGCWGRTVDGEALARLAGAPEPADPETYARDVLGTLLRGAPVAPDTRAAAEETARALGAGIAGLVNAHDPQVITLGGLAPLVRAAAPDTFNRAYQDGLMLTNRASPPPVRDGAHDDDGTARGALSLGFHYLTTPSILAAWASDATRQPI